MCIFDAFLVYKHSPCNQIQTQKSDFYTKLADALIDNGYDNTRLRGTEKGTAKDLVPFIKEMESEFT